MTTPLIPRAVEALIAAGHAELAHELEGHAYRNVMAWQPAPHAMTDDAEAAELQTYLTNHHPDVRPKYPAGLMAWALAALAQPAAVEHAKPTKAGIYAWIPRVGSPSLVLVDKRPSDHSKGGILNGHVMQSGTFYNGCAIDAWTGGVWFGPFDRAAAPSPAVAEPVVTDLIEVRDEAEQDAVKAWENRGWNKCRAEFLRLLMPARKAIDAQGAEGWKLVPLEPNDEMINALRSKVDLEESDPEDHRYNDGYSEAKEICRAIIAASPLPAATLGKADVAPPLDRSVNVNLLWDAIGRLAEAETDVHTAGGEVEKMSAARKEYHQALDEVTRLIGPRSDDKRVHLNRGFESSGQSIYHTALQRVGTALGLLPGSDITTDCVPAIERLLAQQPAASDELDDAARFDWLITNLTSFHAILFDGATPLMYRGRYLKTPVEIRRAIDSALQSTPAVHAGKGDGHA